jgi:hypothetical protein
MAPITDRGARLLPVITRLCYVFATLIVASVLFLRLDYNGYCPDLGIGLGGSDFPNVTPCPFLHFYFDVDHLPLVALQTLLLLLIIILYIARIWLFISSPGKKDS